MINKHELECLTNYYYGNTELQEIGYLELKKISEEGNIKRIYGVYEDEEYNSWYLICTKKGKSKIVPTKKGDILGRSIVEEFKDSNEFFHIRPDMLRKALRKVYPLFYKNDDIDIMRSIDFEEYISEQQYPFCYAKYGDVYLTFSKFNGISIMNKVKTEEEAILSLVSACEADDSVNLDNLFMHVIDNRHYNLEKPQEFVL